MKKETMDNLYMLAGVIIMGFAFNMFLVPNNIVIGGVAGLGIIIDAITTKTFNIHTPVWLTNIVINLPLFLVAIKMKGFRYLKRTAIATFLLSVVLGLTEGMFNMEMDFLLASVFGGVISGIGIGFLFKGEVTTGGSELLASLINTKFKGESIAKLIFIIDLVIILMGLLVFGSLITMYAVISIYLLTKSVDMVLEGLNFAKAAVIISDKYDEVSKKLMTDLDRGITVLYGKGVYTGKDKEIMLVVVSKKQLVKLKEITKTIDENAFIIVSDIREVLGDF